MRVTRVTLRDFRNYARAEAELGGGLTVVCGPNGAGKTNLLEAVYFACTGRSCRTSNEREIVRAGAPLTRVTADVEKEHSSHRLEVGFQPGEPKRIRIDGVAAERLPAGEARPPVSVFLPDRLELVKGSPGLRRAHIDQFVAALWPGRAGTRGAYSRALAQRNALLARGPGALRADSLDAWDAELARHGAALMAERREAAELLAPPFAKRAGELGLPEPAELRYRPRAGSLDEHGLRAALAERRAADMERGFTAHGPHRDDFLLLHDGTSLRAYGSQGQQRLALLALLFAERDLLAERGRPTLMLLDDVMSELDAARRERLAELIRRDGQALVTTTDAEHVPGADEPDAVVLSVAAGTVACESPAVPA
jgi:DNA replication and repair protein RecF